MSLTLNSNSAEYAVAALKEMRAVIDKAPEHKRISIIGLIYKEVARMDTELRNKVVTSRHTGDL